VVLAVLATVVYVAVVRPLLEHRSQTPTPSATAPPAPPPPSPSVGGSVTAPSGVAMPVGDRPGWRQVFADDFTGSTLGPAWDAYTGQPAGDPGGWFDPSHVQVGGGVLTIGAWRDPQRNGLYVTGGVSSRHGFTSTYARYDIRFRMDLGWGIAYALLLWPRDNQYPPEIDIAEDNGRDRRTLYGNLHPTTGRPIENRIAGDFTQWHTVGLEWTPGSAVFTLDGQPWASVTGEAVPSEPMALALQTQAWYCGHTWEACPDETTPPVVNLQVDWVVAYVPE
jgi:beta-glucanase (GH16 family)